MIFPFMPHHVMGQGDGHPQFLPKNFQMPVDTVGGVDILFPLICSRSVDNGKKVRGSGDVVTVHDFLHARLPFYKELLAGFLPPV